jgi:hypothetical protein
MNDAEQKKALKADKTKIRRVKYVKDGGGVVEAKIYGCKNDNGILRGYELINGVMVGRSIPISHIIN